MFLNKSQLHLAWQNFFRDGLPDLYVGLMIFLFGYFTIQASTSFLAIVFLLGSLMLRQLKLKNAVMRTSEIQDTLIIRSPIVPLIFLLCLAFVFQIVSIRGTFINLVWWDFWSLITMMMFFVLVYIYIGFKTSSLRYLIYAGLSLACGISNILGLINSHNNSQFLMMVGIIPFFIGLFLYVKFLRQVPESKSA